MEECLLPYDRFPSYELHLFVPFLPPTYFRYQAHARWENEDNSIEGVRLARLVPFYHRMYALYCWHQLGRIPSSMEK